MLIRTLSFLLAFGFVRASYGAECDAGSTCVAEPDLHAMIEIVREKQCLSQTVPTFELDPVIITVDRAGRIFYSTKGPQPYKLRIKWCVYDIEAQGKLNVVAAVQEPPWVGFRFRPKAYLGALLAEPFQEGRRFRDAWDAGAMIDMFYVRDFNLNAHVGFRAVGLGLGVDLVKNFGVYAGYAYGWTAKHNPEAALWFAFF
jgi:hypothetical protein